jgi:hypothetical protein
VSDIASLRRETAALLERIECAEAEERCRSRLVGTRPAAVRFKIHEAPLRFADVVAPLGETA